MSESSSKTELRLKLGLPSIAELEISREWRADRDSVVCYGDQIAIRLYDGTYWQVNRDHGDKIMGLGKQVAQCELIEIVDVANPFASHRNRPIRCNEKVGLRFTSNNCFAGADFCSSITGELTARVPWVKEWETFTLVDTPTRPLRRDKKVRWGSWFALRASNGKYVMFDKNDTKQLLACAPRIDEWETFVIIDPLKPQ